MFISIGLLLSTLAIHTGLQRLGVNLSWSVFLLYFTCHECVWCIRGSVAGTGALPSCSDWVCPNPSHRSIALAMKWCSRREWIRLDSVPFSSLTRDCGALLGLGMAQYWKPGGWSLPWVPRALALALSSMGLYHVHRLPLPPQPQGLFYCLYFLKFLLVPQLVMVLMPGMLHLLTYKTKNE